MAKLNTVIDVEQLKLDIANLDSCASEDEVDALLAKYQDALNEMDALENEAPVEETPAEEATEEATAPVEEAAQEEAPVEAAAEDADEEDEEDEAEEEDEEDEAEELEEGEEEEPISEPADAKEKAIAMPDIQIVDENGDVKKIKRTFKTRMMFADYDAKVYYNEIKNYLMMYRAKGRYSSRCEIFRYKGLVAKVALAGKSVKVCLAINPSDLEGSKYHFKDVSAKKQYAEVPTMIKVRSERGLKYFKELVDNMMASRLVKAKRNYEPTNFIPQLIPNGEAILATIGMSNDYLLDVVNAKGIPSEMPDNLEDYLPAIQGNELDEEEDPATVFLDTLCTHFNDGDEITIDVLKSLHVVTKGNVLKIKARGTLDRKFIIYAEYFEPDALKMLMCTNCTAIKVVR